VQQRLQPDLARIRLQLGQQLAEGEILQALCAVLTEPRHDAVAELLLEPGSRRADNPLDTSWWFQPLGTASHLQCFAQPLVAQLDRADLAGQPIRQLVLVRTGELTKAERVADLRTVVLNRTARPSIPDQLGRIDLHLLAHVNHGRRRKLVRRPGKPCLDLEELQDQREAETGRNRSHHSPGIDSETVVQSSASALASGKVG
jgi:hypothetical protein